MNGSPEAHFIPVRVSTLRPSVPLLFDVYIHFKERYLQYRKAKDAFEEDRIAKFMAKKVKKVFIREEQEPFYLQYLESALDDLTRKDVTLEQKADFAAQTMASEAENIERNLDTEEGYYSTEDRIEKVIDFISAEPGALKSMLASTGLSVDNSQHSATVASLSLAVAAQLGLDDAEELICMSLAALLHDVGIAKLGFDPMIPRENIPKGDLAKWKTHPQASVDQLSGKRYITPRVLKLIVDHHEVGEGMGFPDKKRLAKLPLSSRVFNLCDEFDHWCTSQGKAPADAFDGFVEKNEKLFDMKHLSVLEKLLKS